MGAVPSTVDEYIESCAPEVRAVLSAVRAAVRKAAPQAEERISYRMPALFQHGAVVYFGAFKKHLGLFPPVEDPLLRARAARYAGPKGNLQFPFSEPMPLELIAAIVQARVSANAAKAGAKRGASVASPAARSTRRGT
jgi:uncharacterized protein YdhG (YjbR/CyaY superfamily)